MDTDPQAATRAWIETLSAEELALARDYTTGNHWLILVGLVVSALVTWIIVRTGVLDRLHARLERRGWALRTWLIAALYLTVGTLLTLPLTLYEDWWRETAYGRTSQPLGDFLGQLALSTGLLVLLLSLLLLGVYGLIRRAGRVWWVWAGGLVAGFIAFLLLIAPPLIEPLFNEFEPIPEGEVRGAVLELAAEAGVPAERVFMYDGSRQSNNFTANVSGVGDSARIAISDVAMGEASLDEVRAVTAHEIGHYVLGHVWRMVFVLGALSIVVFWLTEKLYPWFAGRFGTDVPVADVRGLPVFAFVLGLLTVLAQPVTNTVSRIGEREADAYSLENVGLPDALSGALIKTAEYRYPLAGPVEEALFYTHPTVANRVRTAMEWKALNSNENPRD